MINPKEILFNTLLHKDVEQIPWVPFAGVHAGKLLGFTAKEVLVDGEKLFKSLLETNKIYKPCGQPVVFDLQIEAEILGCDLLWADDNPPSVQTHPLSEDTEIPTLSSLPTAESGRLPMVLDVMRRMKAAVGDETALYGLICGPFTLASHLRGTDIFIDMFDDEDYVKDLIGFCTAVAIRMADLYIEAGMDLIAVVDPLVSQISSNHFETFLSDDFKKLFAHIKSKDVFSSFFVCGDATRNVEVMCKTEPDCISVDENIDLVEAKAITDKYNIVIAGNIPLTTVMLHGNQQDNMKFTVDLIDKVGSKKNLIISPGCDMPYDVPIENTVAVTQAVWETEVTREIISNYTAVDSLEDINVTLPDYQNLEKPLIEVFTLDSASCAACTYMMNAVNSIQDNFGDDIDIVEYKYTIKENIARCKKVGVQHLPSVYINGELAFSSIIPNKEVLIKAVERAQKGDN